MLQYTVLCKNKYVLENTKIVIVGWQREYNSKRNKNSFNQI